MTSIPFRDKPARRGKSRTRRGRGARRAPLRVLRLESLEPRRLLSINQSGVDLSSLDSTSTDDAFFAESTPALAPLSLTGTTHFVNAGDSLQNAIDAAVPGDIIELEAGATFVGNFVLPQLNGDEAVTIRSSAHTSLPNGRVSAVHEGLMPKIVSRNSRPAIRAALGATNFQLEGLEITTQSALTTELVLLGFDNRPPATADELARNIIIDRSYIHGLPTGQVAIGVSVSGSNIALTNSEVSDIKAASVEAHALAVNRGQSGFHVENNFLESTGSNLLFGSGDNLSADMQPHDITILGNQIDKSNAWRVGHADYDGSSWSIGDLVDFRVGKQILVEGNTIENTWGSEIALSVVASDGDVDDLQIRNNIIRRAPSLLLISPDDHVLSNVTFENNLAYDIGSNLFGLISPPGKIAQNITIRNNTAMFGSDAVLGGLGSSNLLFGDTDTAVSNLTYQDNVLGGGAYAIQGFNASSGLDAVRNYAQTFDVRGNHVLATADTDPSIYALGNPYEAGGDYYGDFMMWVDVDHMGFADLALAEPEHFSLADNPAFNGKGADIDAILTATKGVPAPIPGVISVAAGESLQDALDAAVPGDIIELEAGATFVGNFVLREKAGNDWITIRSSAHALLPDGRVSADDAALMPRLLTSGSDPVIRAAFGAHHYRLEGLEITADRPVIENLILFSFNGAYPTSVSGFAHDITIDRSYIHGRGSDQVTHGVNGPGGNITLTNSEISNIKRVGFDAQSFVAVMGLSGYTIENNFLEATGENIMFGGLGAGRTIPDAFNPRDIVIRGNTLSKPNAWKDGHPDYEGVDYSVKNLLEFKVGKDILVEGNILDNVWSDSQSGVAILITPREADIDNVMLRNNVIRHAMSAIVITPADHQASNVIFENNLAYGIRRNLFEIVSPDGKLTENITIRNNTALYGDDPVEDGLGSHMILFADTDAAVKNLIFQDNVVGGGRYAVKGTGENPGITSVLRYADGFDIRGNQVILVEGESADSYALGDPYEQDGNYYGDFNLWSDVADLGFADANFLIPEHFSLAESRALTGKGADIDALLNALGLPPAVISVAANGFDQRTVSTVTSSGSGLTSLGVRFSRPVVFSAGDINIRKVTFPDGVETIGDAVSIQSIAGSGTDTLTITLAPGDVVDTWVKVVLSDTIVDLLGDPLDGDAPAVGRGQDFIYDGQADLPTGDHIAGGEAVFYTGNLIGDVNGDALVDINDILIAFSNSTGPNPDAPALPFNKTEIEGDTDGDGDVDSTDTLTLFAKNGERLDALPTTLLANSSLLALTTGDEQTVSQSTSSSENQQTLDTADSASLIDALFAETNSDPSGDTLGIDEIAAADDEESSGLTLAGQVDLLFSSDEDEDDLIGNPLAT